MKTRARVYAWFVIVLTTGLVVLPLLRDQDLPSLQTFLLWIAALAAVQLLPVSLGFGTEVTMGFPLHIAVEILFPPLPAMLIAGLSAFDMREVRREIPAWRALFNRAQLMLAAGAGSAVMHAAGNPDFAFPIGTLLISAGVLAHIAVNLGLVGVMVHRDRGVGLRESYQTLLPKPIGGFWILQAALAALGAAIAAVYLKIGGFVVLFIIPLLFARLSLLGARAQQELSERIQLQQKRLLEATEQVFQERERDRGRIAEEIHDHPLQLLAAAVYGCSNASAFIEAGRADDATKAVEAARDAIDNAISALRGSLVDLRRSTVEEGGLMQTITNFAEQVATLWGTEVRIEGRIDVEPPIPVALAAFQILQEGLTNALKHAQSNTVTVKISDDDDGRVHIVVEDEGAGFDASEEVGADHVGMRLMKERAARVGGTLALQSSPGEGTRVEAILPGGVAS